MNTKYLSFIIGGVITCVSIGVYGWITVTGSSTERFMQLLLFLAPTLGSLFGIQVGVQALKTADETKAIVSPTNGQYMQRAQDAYNAYADRVESKNFEGNPLPKFADLNEQHKLGWYDAVRAGNGEKIS